MAMTNASFRGSELGRRNSTAKFALFNGTRDAVNNPEVDDPTNWIDEGINWPCQLLNTAGGEQLRGRQVTSQTTHVIIGDFAAVQAVTPEMRCTIGATVYGVVAVLDENGDRRQMRIELAHTETTA